MEILLTGRHVELTEAIKNYAEKKFKKLENYFDFKENGRLRVTITVEKFRHIAEADLHSKKHNIAAKVETNDMYSSIDKLEDKLLTQVKKIKEKAKDNIKNRTKKINILANISTLTSASGEKYNEIIEEELQALKPMNTEEAIEETELSKEKMILFYNVDFNKVCLLRKRKDGKYGLTISKY